MQQQLNADCDQHICDTLPLEQLGKAVPGQHNYAMFSIGNAAAHHHSG